MAPVASFLLAFLYLLVAGVIAFHERCIIVKFGADSFTVVLAFVFIYLLLPSIGIHSLLGIYGADLRTGNVFFDEIITNLDLIDSLEVCFLTVIFIMGLYLSAGIGRMCSQSKDEPKKELGLRDVVVICIVFILVMVCIKFFMDLGGDFLEKYANLILFRNQDQSVERTFFSANAFSLTQTLTWLAAGIFFVYIAEKRFLQASLYFFVMLMAAFLMGSRRGLIFPILIFYFSSVLYWSNLHLRKLFFLVPILVVWIAFGKELTGSVAYQVETEVVLGNYDSTGSMMLRAFSDIGITQMQSWAVFQHFDNFPRFGIDHLLSVLRRIPDGMIGLDIDWPERIVRITTEAFTSKDDADIPPGLIGQSWFDFPVIGALLWGVFIGVQTRMLDRWASSIAPSPARTAFVVLFSLVIALPINTGSLDYTFSVDIIILVLLLMIFFRVKVIGQLTAHEGRVNG